MDTVPKLEILQTLGIFKIIFKLLNGKKLNESALFNLCDIVNSIGLFVLDSQFQYKEKNQINTDIYVRIYNNILNSLINFNRNIYLN